MAVDFGKSAQDYATHRAGYPERFFERLATFGIGKPGQRVLDLGTGTGFVARALAGRGATVVGVDKSASMLEQAKALDAPAGVAVEYVAASAEDTRLPSNSFDVVTAATCWHWFDRPRAMQEVQRLLVPGGTLVIAHMDWLAFRSNVVEATERLIAEHNPPWKTFNPGWAIAGGSGIYGTWVAELTQAGFVGMETFSFDIQVPYTHASWRGRIRASAGVGASLDPAAVARFDTQLQALLERSFPQEPLRVPHRVWAVICRRP